MEHFFLSKCAVFKVSVILVESVFFLLKIRHKEKCRLKGLKIGLLVDSFQTAARRENEFRGVVVRVCVSKIAKLSSC